MTKLTVKEVLLHYEVPLVIQAEDPYERAYIGINYGDGEDSHSFYFSRVNQENLSRLFQKGVDVRYIVTKCKIGSYELAELWGEPEETFKTRRVDEIQAEMLPKPGMFISRAISTDGAIRAKAVHIDGQWGIDDLRRFSDRVQDCYAFMYALSGKGTTSVKLRTSSLFHRYPWRGGFSSVNFFDDLYRIIPNSERANIQRIQYASPGTIELRMDSDVADSIKKLVNDINSEDTHASDAYSEVRNWLRDKGWLGKAQDDIILTSANRDELIEKLKNLSTAFGLRNSVEHILLLASSDPLGAVKILLAYYRRLASLADYVATGKAQELFSDVPLKD